MAHKTLIGGTAYDINGGKTLIGGTAYSISGGKTLIGGTGYDISFGTALMLYDYGDECTAVTGGWTAKNSGSILGNARCLTSSEFSNLNGMYFGVSYTLSEYHYYSFHESYIGVILQSGGYAETSQIYLNTASEITSYASTLPHSHVPSGNIILSTSGYYEAGSSANTIAEKLSDHIHLKNTVYLNSTLKYSGELCVYRVAFGTTRGAVLSLLNS